jgi:hypothetical protein
VVVMLVGAAALFMKQPTQARGGSALAEEILN